MLTVSAIEKVLLDLLDIDPDISEGVMRIPADKSSDRCLQNYWSLNNKVFRVQVVLLSMTLWK